MAANQKLMNLAHDKSILLVEDEQDAVDALFLILEKYFQAVTIATSGEEGLEKFREMHHDIIITDIKMAKMSGLDMIAEIKNMHLDPEIIVATAFSNNEYLFEAINLGVSNYLVKPLSFTAINEKLIKACTLINNKKDALEKIELSAKLQTLNKQLEEKVAEETNKRLLQEQILIQQGKMAQMGELMGVIAHQWKQPVSVISLVFQMLKDELNDENGDIERLKEYIDDGTQQIIFLINTIDDFKNFLKPSKERTNFSISKLIEEIKNIVSALLLQSNTEVMFNNDDKDCIVFGYENELKHVFLNLFSNTIDALNAYREKQGLSKSEYEGAITITITQNDGFGTVSFCDNAGGIDEKVIPKLFGKYISSKGESGTGIGLYMAKSIIEENMGGEMSAKNSEKGACFNIRIPLATNT